MKEMTFLKLELFLTSPMYEQHDIRSLAVVSHTHTQLTTASRKLPV